MNKNTSDIYSELSQILTDYNTGNATTNDLYKILVKIQKNWNYITSEKVEYPTLNPMCITCKEYQENECSGTTDSTWTDCIYKEPTQRVDPLLRFIDYWIPCKNNSGFKCPKCKARISNSEHINGNHHYCHKCGAKLQYNYKRKE